jgi:hypothetical protein
MQVVERFVAATSRRLPLAAARPAPAGPPVPGAGEVLDGLRKVDVLVVHDEAEGVAAGAAAEAVVELLLGIDAEGGGLFVVEGAARAVVLAGFLELHAPVDDVDDVDAIEQVIDEGLGYAAGHGVAGLNSAAV